MYQEIAGSTPVMTYWSLQAPLLAFESKPLHADEASIECGALGRVSQWRGGGQLIDGSAQTSIIVWCVHVPGRSAAVWRITHSSWAHAYQTVSSAAGVFKGLGKTDGYARGIE